MGQLGQLTVGLVVIAISTWVVAVFAFAARRGTSGRVARAAASAPGAEAATVATAPAIVPAPAEFASRMGIRRAIWPRAGATATSAAAAPEQAAAQRAVVALRPLSDSDRDRYEAAWRGVQSVFVDDPRAGVDDADRLVENVLRARGYQTESDDQDASRSPGQGVGLPEAAARFAAAHDIAARRDDPNMAPNELWQAMADYQAAIDTLLEGEPASAAPPAGDASATRSS